MPAESATRGRSRPLTAGIAACCLLSLLAWGVPMAAAMAAEEEPLATSLSTGVNTAIVPVAKLEKDSYAWFPRHDAVLAQQKSVAPEIVLIGDSITHFWGGEPRAAQRRGAKAWQETFGDRPVLNMGFGWDRTQNVLWRLDHGEMAGLSPRVIVLNIGGNNFKGTKTSRENSPAEVAEATMLILDRLHAASPASRIIVMGTFPRGEKPDAPFRARARALNELLATRLAGRQQVSFLDIGARFLAEDGTISRTIMSDFTHPTEAGYAIWGHALLDAGILGDDAHRPAPPAKEAKP